MDTHFNLLMPNSLSSMPMAAICGSTLYFSKMAIDDDLRSVAAGLQRRDPELIDRLIDQYQHRLFRYLVYLTANRERAEDFFRKPGFGFSNEAINTMADPALTLGFS